MHKNGSNLDLKLLPFYEHLLPVELAAIFLQPPAPRLVIRHDRGDLRPKGPGVIGFAQMTKFVHDHIVDDRQRRHHQPPGEIDISLRTARSPTRAGGGEFYFFNIKAVFFGEKCDALIEDAPRFFFIPFFKIRFCFTLCRPGKPKSSTQAERGFFCIGQFKRIFFTQEKKNFTLGKLTGREGSFFRLGLCLLLYSRRTSRASH